jgi:hypothetical protein
MPGVSKAEWAARIALFGTLPALAGAVLLFNTVTSNAERAAAAASCSGFADNAQKLFEDGGAGTLSGTFTPGDHIHLAIDFKGAAEWQSTGALGVVADVHVRSAVTVLYTQETSTSYSFGGLKNWLRPSPVVHTASGTIDRAARVELEIDVTTAGPGAIAVKQTGSEPSAARPTVRSARCDAALPRTAMR